jgi:hypothetical protein
MVFFDPGLIIDVELAHLHRDDLVIFKAHRDTILLLADEFSLESFGFVRARPDAEFLSTRQREEHEEDENDKSGHRIAGGSWD